VDLGCGTGELTLLLHRALGASATLGLDASAEMLHRAPVSEPGLTFQQGRIEDFQGEDLDVVFSNAAIHWCQDHPALFDRLTRLLADKGQLAVQMPANFDHPSHRLAQEVFRQFSSQALPSTPVLSPREYAELLYRLGFAAQSVQARVYGHVLESTDAVVEWTRGTTLLPYQERLSASDFAAFLERYRERLSLALGAQAPYFYSFNRILLWARR